MKYILIQDKNKKQEITRSVLEELKDWFEVDESREEYINLSRDLPFFACYDDEKEVGFICLKETSKDTLELCVMGVLKEYHRKGIGKKLFEHAKKYAKDMGYSFIQVKTVQMGYYEEYDNTNRFYLKLGFKELEVIKNIWDDKNPCQIYIMNL